MLAYALENSSKMYETPFYQIYSFGSQFRMNAQGTDINFQRSKLHRYLIGMKPSIIKLNDPNQVGLFKMVLAQNLKVFDDRGATETLAALERFLGTKEAKQAVATLRAMIVEGKTDIAEADLDNLVKVVGQGGEETASLKALVSYMEFQEAEGSPSFETTLTFELDGKSNGPFNALVQLGLTRNNPTALLAGAGLFLDGTESYSEFKQNPANFDFYELVMAKAHEFLNNTELDPVSQTLLKYTGTLTVVDEDGNVRVTPKGRKFVKPDVTTFTYAAGKASRHRNIASSIKDNIMDELQSYHGKDIKNDAYRQLIDDINQVFGTKFPRTILPSKIEINSFHQSKFEKNVGSEIGDIITQATGRMLPSLDKNSENITTAGNLIYTMFTTQFNHEVKKLHARLVADNKLSQYESLTLNQLAEVKAELTKAMPIYNLLQSKDESYGVQTMKNTTQRVDDTYPLDSALYSSDSAVYQKGLEPSERMNIPVYSSVRTFESPGAGTLAMLTQASGDAVTMNTLYGNRDSLSIYDARITSVNDIEYIGNRLNISGFKALITYDMFGAVSERFDASYEMLSSSIKNMTEEELLPLRKEMYVAYYADTYSLFYNRKNGVITIYPEDEDPRAIVDYELPDKIQLVRMLSEHSKFLANEAQINSEAKKNLLKKNVFFAQFGGIGSGVEFDNGELVAESKPDENVGEQEATNFWNSQTKEDSEQEEGTNEDPVENTGAVTLSDYSDPKIITVFKKGNVQTFKDFKGVFKGKYEFIYEALAGILPEDTAIHRIPIDKQAPLKSSLGELDQSQFRGYMNPDYWKGPTVFVHSEENVWNSGMNSETILHELIHLATKHIVEKYLNNEDIGADKKAVLDELDILRKRLISEFSPQEGSSLHNATVNLDEFLAWGMTNDSVQKTLDQVKVDPAKVGVLTNAVKTIIGGIRRLLGLPKARGDTALAQIVAGFDVLTKNKPIIKKSRAESFVGKMADVFNQKHNNPLDKAIDKSNKELSKAVDELPDEGLDGSTSLDTDLAAKEAEENKIKTTTKAKPKNRAYIEDDVEALFANSNEITLGDIDGLFDETNVVESQLYQRIKEFLPKDIKIVRLADDESISIETPNGDLSSDMVKSFTDTDGTIYLNGANKPIPSMDKASILYELIGSAVKSIVNDYESGQKVSADKKKLLKDLDALRIKLQKEFKKDVAMTNNLYNLSSFLAYGLSSKAAMEKLKKVGIDKRKTTILKKAAGKILSGIRGILGIKETNLSTAFDQLVNTFDELTVVPYGSTKKPSLSAPQRTTNTIRQMDLMSVFDRLRMLSHESVPAAHLAHLKDTLQYAIIKVINPVKLQFTDAEAANTTEEDMIFSRLETDVHSDLLVLRNAGFRLSGEEALVYGLYSPIVDSALNEFSWDTREIRKLYNFAAKELSWESFVDQDDIIETSEDRAISRRKAQARYDVLFGTKAKSGINNSLRNFITLAQTNENFRQVLDNLATPTFASKQIRADGFVKTLSNLMSAIMDFMSNTFITKGSDPNVRSKLDKLAHNIRYREAVEKNKLQQHASMLGITYSKAMKGINKGLIKGIDVVLNNTIKRAFGPATIEGVIRIAGAIVSQEHAQKFAFALDTVQNSLSRGNAGFISSLYDDFKGTNKSNWRLHKLLLAKNRLIDQAGKHLKDRTSKLLLNEYSQTPNEREEVALTKAGLKTDLSSLFKYGYNLVRLRAILDDKAVLERRIQKVIQRISSTGQVDHNHFFIKQAHSLGEYMALGHVTSGHLLFNAESIAAAHGISHIDIPVNEQQRVEPLIDELASLFALLHTESRYKKEVSNIIRRESERTDGKNGFVFTMDLHNLAKQNARETIFQNQTKSIIKGYTKELTSPYISMVTANVSEEQELASLGYTRIMDLTVDPDDVENETRSMYVSEEGGNVEYLQGGISLASRKRKGRSLDNPESVQEVYDARVASGYIDSLFTDNEDATSGAVLVPSINENGDIIAYRYLAAEDTKDNILGKDNRFSQVLGAEFTSTQNKIRSVDINSQLLNALRDQYDEDLEAGNTSRYVYISPTSSDRNLKEIYRLLPIEAREEAKALFGDAGIAIRNDLISDAFGYRKFSIAELWDKDADLPELVQKTLGAMLQTAYGKQMLPYFLKLERGIQELVKEIKDLVVIKSMVVLRDNIISNTVQLKVIHGVSAERIVKGQARAYVAAEEYIAGEQRIFELNLRNKLNPLNQADQKELENLLDAQARNPERELIEAGLLQAIIEDVDTEAEDAFGYKGSLQSKIAPYTKQIPKKFRDALSEVAISQGSSVHSLLSKGTQLSDFASRSVLYDHLIQVEGKSKDQALMEVQEAFVNYDRNLNKGLQYMSDMGIVWFPKYFIRMQKIIMKSFRESPARVLALLYGEYLLDINVPTPIDSSVFISDIPGKFGLMEGIERASDAHPIAQLY